MTNDDCRMTNEGQVGGFDGIVHLAAEHRYFPKRTRFTKGTNYFRVSLDLPGRDLTNDEWARSLSANRRAADMAPVMYIGSLTNIAKSVAKSERKLAVVS